MPSSYDRRQDAGSWPTKGPWTPDGLPGWYVQLLGDLAGNLTRWRDEHDPGQELDPRNDPRFRRHVEERARASR